MQMEIQFQIRARIVVHLPHDHLPLAVHHPARHHLDLQVVVPLPDPLLAHPDPLLVVAINRFVETESAKELNQQSSVLYAQKEPLQVNVCVVGCVQRTVDNKKPGCRAARIICSGAEYFNK